ncbi:uncharacterized protein LOC112202328 isoform X2 [Rosa chinensis]|uniref:uncharacterized protein LOC112202328 isoform X2 n=1 Tax=Rosa chinensis TaxID=74649 RepID=UPI001AD8DC88|nr:uncharacterized protein LOC112202328 isoform X2 [Rosa chinensis]
MEDLDSRRVETSPSSPVPSYASLLKNPVDRFHQTMVEDFEMTDEDYSYSAGKHGLNVSFSQKVHNKLDYDCRSAVIVKLMGKPNSTNALDFMLRGLRRKWQLKGGWHLIDLPNDYFIVKFNLDEDMNQVLYGGPWILVGQTLVVQKWRPEFDPAEEKISRMALWIDQVTLGQARGKFARVYIEIDLSKPLRLFVEVEGVVYGVVYEGISMICFECGCYGHVKDKCPHIHTKNVTYSNASVNANHTSSDGSGPDVSNDNTQQDMDTAQVNVVPSPPIMKKDMGPWMLMTYKNKRRTNTNNGDVKKVQGSGSRFAVLQEVSGEENIRNEMNAPLSNEPASASDPPIVKLWKNLQEKVQLTKVPKENDDKASDKSNRKRVMNEEMKRSKDKLPARVPMKDVSNEVIGPSGSGAVPKFTMWYQRKSKVLTNPGTSTIGVGISTSICQENNVQSCCVPAVFGHCPPEEKVSNGDCSMEETISNAAENFVEKTFTDNSVLAQVQETPSLPVEGIVSEN